MRSALIALCLLATAAQAQTDFPTWLRDFKQHLKQVELLRLFHNPLSTSQ